MDKYLYIFFIDNNNYQTCIYENEILIMDKTNNTNNIQQITEDIILLCEKYLINNIKISGNINMCYMLLDMLMVSEYNYKVEVIK